MKALTFDLIKDVVGSYNKLKTTITGRVFQKTVNGDTVLGPPLTGWIDTFVDCGLTPAMCFLTPNGRLFCITAPSTGVATLFLYNFDLTGQTKPTYVGRCNIVLPNSAATTHTLKQFKVIDNGTSGWKVLVSTTGSVAINGGAFVVWNLALTDFLPVSFPTIGLGISSDSKAVYFMQDPSFVGVDNNLTLANGGPLDSANQLLYTHFNAVATHFFCVFDLNQTPQISTFTTTGPTSSGSPTFNMTGHSFKNNDPVVIISNNPTPFVATTALVQTVYFARNVTANTFELSATSGGASISATSIASGTVFARAFGITTSNWANRRTGVISGVVGTLLTNNSENYCIPANGPLSGQVCGFFCTSSNMYLYKLSDVQNGVTTLPSLTTVNTIGNGVDYSAITPTFARYSTACDLAIYTSNTSVFYAKKWLNSAIKLVFGQIRTNWLENVNLPTIGFGFTAIINTDIEEGWLLVVSATTGQRGIMYLDLLSDLRVDSAFIYSKIIKTNKAKFISITDIEKLFDYTDSLQFSFRTAATIDDAIFNSTSGGWIDVSTLDDLSSYVLDNYTQIRVGFYIATTQVATPAQIHDAMIIVEELNELSDKWAFNSELSTKNSESPAKTVFQMIDVYDSVVPKLYFRAYNLASSLVVEKNTTDNASEFEYSADGITWHALGTVTNTVGTKLRYNWTTPAGTDVLCSLRES